MSSRSNYKYILKNFFEEFHKASPESADLIVSKYDDILNVYNESNCDEVMLANYFVNSFKNGFLRECDGYAFFYDIETMQTVKGTAFNIDNMECRAKKYKYVVWYNK